MIKMKPSCSYHSKNIQYICTFVDCNYQTRLLCLECCQNNEVLYHQHKNVANCRWVISLLKYHIDELISLSYHFYFQQKHKQLTNSFLELNHYLQCLFEWKLGKVIQQNYLNLLEQIGPNLKELYFLEQNINKNCQIMKQPNSILEIDNFIFLKMWRKYMLFFALISENQKYLVLGWSKYIAIYQLNDLKIIQYIYLGNRFNQCQFTQNSRRLLVGTDYGLHLYDNRYFRNIKNFKLKSNQRILVRNIIFIKNNIVLVNIFSVNPQSFTQIMKFFITNNKMIYRLIFQDDLYLQFDFKNNMIILNNQRSIKIYQEFDKIRVIEYILIDILISQVQYIKDNLITAHCKSGSLLFFQINYKLNQILLIRQINLIPKLFFYNGITQEIVVQTEQHLIFINCHSFEQINIPFHRDHENAKNQNYYQNRILRQQQNSLNYLITYGRNNIALFLRK